MTNEIDEWMNGGQLQQCEGDRLTPENQTAGVKAPEARQRGKQPTPPSANIEEEGMREDGQEGERVNLVSIRERERERERAERSVEV